MVLARARPASLVNGGGFRSPRSLGERVERRDAAPAGLLLVGASVYGASLIFGTSVAGSLTIAAVGALIGTTVILVGLRGLWSRP
ncbi:MAG TPA: hypothetical protein VJ397_02170 [Thermoplasmata archaeon]|nr:hypothetical protein [Thermoplasmata archaeon]